MKCDRYLNEVTDRLMSLSLNVTDCVVNWSSESTVGCLDSVGDVYSSRRIRLHVIYHLEIPL